MNSEIHSNVSQQTAISKVTKKKPVLKRKIKDPKQSTDSVSLNDSDAKSTTLDIFDNDQLCEQQSIKNANEHANPNDDVGDERSEEPQSSKPASASTKSHIKKIIPAKKIKQRRIPKKNPDLPSEPKMYSIYKIPKYYLADAEFIRMKGEEYELAELIEILEKRNNCYHTRTHKNTNYKFFGDCDNYGKGIDRFMDILIKFLDNRYGLKVTLEDILYTENKSVNGSYHYVMPSYYASCEKLYEIHSNFLDEHRDEFTYEVTVNDRKGPKKKIKNNVDTTVYTEKWFRCPNQSKEGVSGTEHIIVKGTMKDFIFDFIEDDSKCIEDLIYKDPSETTQITESPKKIIKSPTESNKPELKPSQSPAKDDTIKNIEWNIYYKFFDLCYKQERFDNRATWVKVGQAIKNRYGDLGFELFKFFSKKAANPDPDDSLLKTYNGFKSAKNNPITIGSIYHYAKEDNKEQFTKLIHTESPFKKFSMTSVDVAKYIKLLKPTHFVWVNRKLYCFNGCCWENDDLEMKMFISNELYDFLQDILVTCFWTTDSRLFDPMKKSLDRLKNMNFKEEIIKTSREYLTDNEIEFDDKWYLFGFKNVVYDLKKGKFRDYSPDDYVLTTTGYNWVVPTEDTIKKMHELINLIFPIVDERSLYLEILSTTLEGRCLEKFIIFNGEGGNGKGLMDDILLAALGPYGIVANNAILFEKSRTGSNPERANIDKKRFVVFRELSEKNKIENSIMREMTGGGSFSARGHNESNTDKKLHGTTVAECNDRPPLAQEPKRADIRRLIDIFFRSLFTDYPELVDHSKYIYLANQEYKTAEFHKKHRIALLFILFEAYKEYQKRNYTFNIPKSVKDRTNMYLEQSSSMLGWINETYDKTDNVQDYVIIKDMYHSFIESEYYHNLSKSDKRKLNYKNFICEIEGNTFLKKSYHERKKIDGCDYRNILTNYKIKTELDRNTKKKFDNNAYEFGSAEKK
ncbi:MAG: DNA primase [Hyperionvirus sp.]|uniref:DNA primase n=1 Tax=Hyperionvirus sp. TaxID=2487770 RepID=A0A3G5AAZ7_9VIRU|nr:MAG: DNA primase [Hyperionvirus sp.]